MQGDIPLEPQGADLGFLQAVIDAGWPEQVVMLVLLVFSIASWGIIVQKHRILRRAQGESEAFLAAFWASKRLDAIFDQSERFGASPVSEVFRAGYVELAKLKQGDESHPRSETQTQDLESVARSMRRATTRAMTALEAFVPFLATTAATAPFIGLLGTVIGIMGAFHTIGLEGNAQLATVAPSVGGALVATAFGLFAAIPAVMAFNLFSAKLRRLESDMAAFHDDFLNIVKRHFL